MSLRGVGLGLAAALLAGCIAFPGESADLFGRSDTVYETSAPALASVRWRLTLSTSEPFEPTVEERATAGFAANGDLLVGSAAGWVSRIHAVTHAPRWKKEVGGGVDCTPIHVAALGTVYFGADDGVLYALDADTGRVRWKHYSRGEIDGPLAVAGERILFTNSENVLYAVDARSGEVAWSARRDAPEAFTVRGSSSPTVAGDRVVVGFADGYLGAYDVVTGSRLWETGLARSRKTFRDVDGKPLVVGDRVFAASFSGGLFALDIVDGVPVWHRPEHQGVGAVVEADGVLYFSASTSGYLQAARATDGRALWTTRVHDTGAMTDPVVVGDAVLVGADAGGILAFDRFTGRYLSRFDPGSPVDTPPAVSPSGLYITTTGGFLYRLDWL